MRRETQFLSVGEQEIIVSVSYFFITAGHFSSVVMEVIPN